MPQNKKKKIFLVDDHPILREGLAKLINQQDDMVVCGEGSDVTNSKIEIRNTRPDVTVVDISLGKSSGLRLIEELKHDYPEIKIMTFSMHDESTYAERCLKAGAMGYLMKQEPPESVIEAIRSILQGNIYISNKLQQVLINKLRVDKADVHESSISLLSNRELEIYDLIGQGMKTKEIAEKLNLSVKTIESHIDNIKRKLSLKDLHSLHTHAVRWVESEKIN